MDAWSPEVSSFLFALSISVLLAEFVKSGGCFLVRVNFVVYNAWGVLFEFVGVRGQETAESQEHVVFERISTSGIILLVYSALFPRRTGFLRSVWRGVGAYACGGEPFAALRVARTFRELARAAGTSGG